MRNANVPMGMTLRDWLAGLAMQQLIAGSAIPLQISEMQVIANEAYRMSDAMIEVRDIEPLELDRVSEAE